MGHIYAKYISEPEVTPFPDEEPTFDPLYGFPNGRKPRVMVATEQEMMAMNIPLARRDFCAHKYMQMESCFVAKAPFNFLCAHQKHEYEACQFEDYVLRMKEYERERRLRQRQWRKEKTLQEEVA